MAASCQIFFSGQAADADFQRLVNSLDVEENADLPGAIELTMPLSTQGAPGAEDLTLVGDDRLAPYAPLAVVVTPHGGSSACIFDGYVLSHRIHVDRGTTEAKLRVWGQDASCLMNLEERLYEWKDKTDGEAANDIFRRYGFQVADGNTDDDSPQHTESGRTLIQRATDAQFLRDRARRSGKLFRVCCEDQPGLNTGYFIKPDLDASAATTLVVNPPQDATVDGLDFEWDVARPTRVHASVLVATKEPQDGGSEQSGLSLLDARSLADFAGSDHVMEARLTAAADSAGELKQRSVSLLREAGWFVRCEGQVDIERQRAVLRVGQVVEIAGAGKVHSGKYFVWKVRHTIKADSHLMRFVLFRNAVGPS